MISSSKAKDKETEAPGFLLRKHREQAYKQRRGPQSKQHRADTLLFRRSLRGTVTRLRKSLRCDRVSGSRDGRRRRLAGPIWKIMALQMKLQEGARKKRAFLHYCLNCLWINSIPFFLLSGCEFGGFGKINA